MKYDPFFSRNGRILAKMTILEAGNVEVFAA
jgi:hypothetical protein